MAEDIRKNMIKLRIFSAKFHHCRGAAQVWGLVFLAFCLGAGTQQWIGAAARADTAGEATLAELCGMHGRAALRGQGPPGRPGSTAAASGSLQGGVKGCAPSSRSLA